MRKYSVNNLVNREYILYFVPITGTKVKVKEMEKTKKNEVALFKGAYTLIARRVGCHPKYVSMVLNEKLGKYNARETETVKLIRKTAEQLEQVFVE